MNPTALIAAKGQSAAVYGKSQTVNNDGTRSDTWTVKQALTAWMQATSSDIREQYERREMTVTHKAFAVTNPSVTRGDVLVIGGQTYLIRGVVNQAGLDRCWRLDVEETRIDLDLTAGSSSSSSSTASCSSSSTASESSSSSSESSSSSTQAVRSSSSSSSSSDSSSSSSSESSSSSDSSSSSSSTSSYSSSSSSSTESSGP